MAVPPTDHTESPPIAELGDSFRAFFEAAGQFFENLAAIRWPWLLAGLVCHGLFLSLRSRAWYNGLRAAYPGRRFKWRGVWAAEIAGNGVSSVIPARAGAFLRLYLGKNTVPESSYTTVASSFMVALPFDLLIGSLILIYGFTQGIFPSVPDLSKLNAFDLSFFARHPRFTVFFLTAMPILLLALFGYLSVRVRSFWTQVRRGVTLLRSRSLWMRGAARIQAVAWVFRFASIWFLLEAFNIGGTADGVLVVLAVQGVASLIPLTPQGAGVQQALLVHAFSGAAAGATVAAYSVGQQVAIAAFNAVFGMAALAVVFRTTNWRELMARGRAEQDAERRERRDANGGG